MEIDPEFESGTAVAVEGVTPAEGEALPFRRQKFVSPGLFQTVGTLLVAGRDFAWTDLVENREVAMVSRNMARDTWGAASAAVGKRIREGDTGPWREVIGVVADVHDNGAHAPAPAIVYWPARVTGSNDLSRSVAFAIRSERTGTESLLGELREAVWSVNASLPLARVQMLGEVYDHSMVRTSFTLVMLAIAASMALALGVVGLYGVISYVLSQRHREVGIRLALGAQPAELKRMFVRHGLALAGVGIALGLVVAAALTRFMSPLLYGVGTLDPMTYLAVPFVLAAAAALASYLPARRAARVDPLVALRCE
jgi:hypothetical protein